MFKIILRVLFVGSLVVSCKSKDSGESSGKEENKPKSFLQERCNFRGFAHMFTFIFFGPGFKIR